MYHTLLIMLLMDMHIWTSLCVLAFLDIPFWTFLFSLIRRAAYFCSLRRRILRSLTKLNPKHHALNQPSPLDLLTGQFLPPFQRVQRGQQGNFVGSRIGRTKSQVAVKDIHPLALVVPAEARFSKNAPLHRPTSVRAPLPVLRDESCWGRDRQIR